MKHEERLYAFHQHDNYGERYLFFKYCLRFVGSHMTSYLACNPSQMLETIMSLSQSMLLMIPDIRIYEALGHNKAVREETLFRRLPQSITHAPYTEGWCSWGRVNDADDYAERGRTGGTFSCCCMQRSISLQAGDRIP